MDYSKFRKIKITDNKMDFWFKKQRNVLLVGKHGVGKTTQIIDCFNRNNLKINESFKVFSGGTLDPWTDFIGIPKRTTEENGKEYLEYIRPEHMDDRLEAIFMDEYNRTNPKVRNALMELIQFKSINGKKFPNLKVVWAAVNPDEDGYDVDEVDDAQGDRFHIIVQLPYAPDLPYFKRKYGENMAIQAVEWWKQQPAEAKDLISPRRLDYSLEYYNESGDVSEMLPVISTVEELKAALNESPHWKQFQIAFSRRDLQTIKRCLNEENSFEDIQVELLKDKKYYRDISLHLKPEKLNILLMKNDTFFDWAVSESNTNNRLREAMKDIYDSIEDKSKFNQHRYVNLKSIFKVKDNPSNKFLVFSHPIEKFDTSENKIDSSALKLKEKIDFYIEKADNIKNSVDSYKFFKKIILYFVDVDDLPLNIKLDYLNFLNFITPTITGNVMLFKDYKKILTRYGNDILSSLINSGNIDSADIYRIFNSDNISELHKIGLNLSEVDVLDREDVVIL